MVAEGTVVCLAVAVPLARLTQPLPDLLEAVLAAQSVLSTPAIRANSHQLTWRIRNERAKVK
jgi:hypothetical protein